MKDGGQEEDFSKWGLLMSWVREFFVVGIFSAHVRMLNSISGFYPPDASSTPPTHPPTQVVKIENVRTLSQISLGEGMSKFPLPFKNHWSGVVHNYKKEF